MALLYNNNNTTGISELFICCGRNGHRSNRMARLMAVARKYFFTKGLFLFMRKEKMICVGNAQIRLKLFFVILWSVKNHMNKRMIPKSPVVKKSRPSNPLRTDCAYLFLERLSEIKKPSNNEKKRAGLSQLFLSVLFVNW